MNYSDWVLPFSRALKADPALIETILKEIEDLALFQYQYIRYTEIPDFLHKAPYTSFLKGADEVILIACTLGPGIDRKIAQLERLDLRKAYLFDRCAGFVLEKLADEAEKKTGLELSKRFCPGYGKSPLSDIQEILKRVKPGFIKINDFNIMTPSKSMAGFCGIGIHPDFECDSTCETCLKEKLCA